MSQRFLDVQVSREGRYALGRDTVTGAWFLSIPVANNMVDYEEYYRLDGDEYDRFRADPDAALAFADACRAHIYDDRLILKPGTDRGVAV